MKVCRFHRPIIVRRDERRTPVRIPVTEVERFVSILGSSKPEGGTEVASKSSSRTVRRSNVAAVLSRRVSREGRFSSVRDPDFWKESVTMAAAKKPAAKTAKPAAKPAKSTKTKGPAKKGKK
jgi:hypothetical protein